MTFLHNHFINIATTKLKKIIHFGSLHTIGRNFLAVEFYSEPIINSINYSERPYLCTSSSKKQNLKGSITIEASIAFPIFIIVSYALISIISVLYLQLSMQIALEETIRSTSKSAYISSLFLIMLEILSLKYFLSLRVFSSPFQPDISNFTRPKSLLLLISKTNR